MPLFSARCCFIWDAMYGSGFHSKTKAFSLASSAELAEVQKKAAKRFQGLEWYSSKESLKCVGLLSLEKKLANVGRNGSPSPIILELGSIQWSCWTISL